ncbi:hypothetical protein OG478_00725 [Streptomyces phaeochromogenes]|uniref:hypothetical protein n=1 Tax=Streptomyces phaeochromogenes TaxID=1923 RepID=UPI00386D26A7|nr:hypothetical protein OG478_00725 [Streptomyces phaeochromogenes]
MPAVSRPAPTAIGGAGEVGLLPAAFCDLMSYWLTGNGRRTALRLRAAGLDSRAGDGVRVVSKRARSHPRAAR